VLARCSGAGLPAGPRLGSRREFIADTRPIMKGGRVEVGSIRPHKRAGLGIHGHTIESSHVLKRAEEGAVEHRPKIDALLSAVIKRHRKTIRTNDLEPGDAVDRMRHTLPQWLDLDRRTTGLQQVPILLQLGPMNLHSGFNQALLGLRQSAAEAVERVDREDGGLILIVRVEMRPMMRLAGLDEHANDDSEESREFRHSPTLASSARMLFVGLTRQMSRARL
jgi:hypothetical protein